MKHFKNKKLKGQGLVPYLLLTLLTFLFCYLFCTKYGIFGSKVDWISQHSVFPDYFRQQFYETGKLIPEFASNIGGGQNIYNFAYYGLLSPLFLPSYALPFVKMTDYVMGMSFCCLLASVLLLYHWLRSRDFYIKISFCTALSFLLAGPVIYHSYSQIMFMNYMPFLIFGFLSVDKYFQETSFVENHRILPFRRQLPLIFCLFLMIMTSFYFSIGGMLILVIYGIYRYGQALESLQQKVTIKYFFIDGIHFITSFVIAICLSGLLLVPTAYALFGRNSDGSSSTTKSIQSLASLFLPQIKLSGFLYSPYGLGFGSFILTVLFASLAYKKWSERFLSWSVFVILTVPVFLYVLNGGLYLRYKAFIPFLPLLCYIMANYLQTLDARSKHSLLRLGLVPYLLTILCLVIFRHGNNFGEFWKFILLDGLIMLATYLLFWILHKRILPTFNWSFLLTIPMIVFLAVFGSIYGSKYGTEVDSAFYEKVTDSSIGQAISDILDEDDSYYRISQIGYSNENAANLNRIWDIRQNISSIYTSSYNTEYQNFRQKTFDIEQPFRNYLMQSVSQNPVYQRFMGEKYIISANTLNGYNLYKDYGAFKVYQNPSASPIAYGTNQLMSETDYKKLIFPYNQTALLSYAVVKDTPANDSMNKTFGLKESIQKTSSEKNATEGNIPKQDSCTANIQKTNLNLKPRNNGVGDSDTPSWLSKTSNGYQVKARKHHGIELYIYSEEGSAQDQYNLQKIQSQDHLLFLRFHVKNLHPNKDMIISVNGERNKLSAKKHIYYNNNTTFTYAVSLTAGQDSVKISFGKGSYQITDIEAYIGTLPDTSLYQSEFKLNRSQTKENIISGSIQMENDGYFISTIPYDKNFDIQVDGETVTSEKVNTAFLGCKLSKGEHTIQIIYHAPGLAVGKCMSVIGILLLIVLRIVKK